ncbi:mitochondrial protein [Panus rudis PR-1116 ss-1]|nr:mitochondrial protein [Panus rudis PR-1116 ss-1]
MQPVLQKILVVGGNGFVGSAVCKAALARGMQVTSISSSGKPYTTPKGHSPAWTSKVSWQKADALDPGTYAHLMPGATAVVHTLGTLLEDPRYKEALKEGNVPKLLNAFLSGSTSGGRLDEPSEKPGSYELLNRDSALRMCETFASSKAAVPLEGRPRPFVYVSAEDIFRPFISARYIETKREAEVQIDRMVAGNPDLRPVFIRPSLIYHPHFRPLTSPLAALLDLSATIHSSVPRGLPTPAGLLRSIASRAGVSHSASRPDASPALAGSTSPLDSVANALTIPPIHVDHVAEAICIAADVAREDVRGVYGVREIRELIGWREKGQQQASVPNHV